MWAYYYYEYNYYYDDYYYTHIEVVVTFLVVNFFGFSKITRYHGGFEGRH